MRTGTQKLKKCSRKLLSNPRLLITILASGVSAMKLSLKYKTEKFWKSLRNSNRPGRGTEEEKGRDEQGAKGRVNFATRLMKNVTGKN